MSSEEVDALERVAKETQARVSEDPAADETEFCAAFGPPTVLKLIALAREHFADFAKCSRSPEASTPAPAGWRPISSAPRDGTKVDLWIYSTEFERSFRETDAHWNGECWQLGQYSERQFLFPPRVTHWMPLPPPPSDPTLSDGGSDE